MPESLLLAGCSLPRKAKEPFQVDDLAKNRADNLKAAKASGDTFENPTATFEEDHGASTGGLEDFLTLGNNHIMTLAGDILHDGIQTIVELGGASRAQGRRQILEAGALEIIESCLDFHGEPLRTAMCTACPQRWPSHTSSAQSTSAYPPSDDGAGGTAD